MCRRFQKNIEERKTVSKRLPLVTVTSNVDFDEEWETPKLNPDWTNFVSTCTPCALNFAASRGVTFLCAPSQKIPKTPLVKT
jgi:hypothetical protein